MEYRHYRFRGNPNLIPQFTNSFELNYTRKTKGSITSGIFYRRIEDEITRVIFTNPENQTSIVF
jgi:outer membrane receptor protein involved in Fe transport